MERSAETGGLRVVRWKAITEPAEIPPLGEALRAHIEAYKNPSARAASVCAWALLYETLLGAGLSSGTVAFSPNGKPYFTDLPVLFSISHGGSLAAVSLADTPTGVDVERTDRKVRPQMAARCLSPEETAAFGDDFIRAWCRKECAVKLTGEGLSGYPLAVNALDPRFVFREEILRAADGVYRVTAAFLRESAAG